MLDNIKIILIMTVMQGALYIYICKNKNSQKLSNMPLAQISNKIRFYTWIPSVSDNNHTILSVSWCYSVFPKLRSEAIKYVIRKRVTLRFFFLIYKVNVGEKKRMDPHVQESFQAFWNGKDFKCSPLAWRLRCMIHRFVNQLMLQTLSSPFYR